MGLWLPLPGHVYFDSVKTMQGLRRLLGAVAFRNPDIGYCQSLNFVAGVVFLFTRSEVRHRVAEQHSVARTPSHPHVAPCDVSLERTVL